MSSMMKFSVGALVELLSGGPVMTVLKDKAEDSSKLAQLAWFDGSNLRREVLPKDAVKVVAEAPAKPSKAAAVPAGE